MRVQTHIAGVTVLGALLAAAVVTVQVSSAQCTVLLRAWVGEVVSDYFI